MQKKHFFIVYTMVASAKYEGDEIVRIWDDVYTWERERSRASGSIHSQQIGIELRISETKQQLDISLFRGFRRVDKPLWGMKIQKYSVVLFLGFFLWPVFSVVGGGSLRGHDDVSPPLSVIERPSIITRLYNQTGSVCRFGGISLDGRTDG